MFNEEEKKHIEELHPKDSLRLIVEKFPKSVVFSTSLGQEDQVITDMIFTEDLPIKVFTIDTGRLFYEHYELLSRTINKYKKNIEVRFPESKDVENYVNEKGINAFYKSIEDREQCCKIRKVLPLEKSLEGAKVWITGLRREQSENRKEMKILEWDEKRKLYKFNPLIDWTYQDILEYLQNKKVPENPLHQSGYISIGCAPCTRAIEKFEDPRNGRWWWERSKKECGLHQK